MKYRIVLSLCFLGLFSCKEEVLPKPKAQLKLEYPKSSYQQLENDCPFTFEYNQTSNLGFTDNCGVQIDYPSIKGSIYLTYKRVDENIRDLLLDAEKLTYEHVVKADAIAPKEYSNVENNVYGMFFEVTGNAASQSQFYVTDSINHFVTGSLYFYSKPNYDSILPAAVYLQKDIRRIMESMEWKKE